MTRAFRALALVLPALAGDGRGVGLGDVRGVLRSQGGSDARTGAELVDGLAALGPGAIPTLHDLMRGASFTELVGAEWRPEQWRCEPEEISELCARALGRAPSKDLLRHLDKVLDGAPRVEDLLGVVRLLGATASADALPRVLRCTQALGAPLIQGPRFASALREALTQILSADPRSWSWLEEHVSEIDPAAGDPLLEAIGASGRPQGMKVLVTWFAEGPFERAAIAGAMARIENARPWELEGATLRTCSAWWRSQDPGERAHVARLAGELGSLAVLPELIGFLEDSDALVGHSAHQALERLAGIPLLAEPEFCQTWYERELAWREERWPELAETLIGPEPGPAAEALRELGRHPLYRHEFARTLAANLARFPRPVALAACAEIARTGSRWALPGLVAVLSEPEPRLRAAAWKALRMVTGEERPLSDEHWRTILDL